MPRSAVRPSGGSEPILIPETSISACELAFDVIREQIRDVLIIGTPISAALELRQPHAALQLEIPRILPHGVESRVYLQQKDATDGSYRHSVGRTFSASRLQVIE